jgi:MFS family permease
MTYLGLTVGPSLGGWLAEAAGWRFVFLINIPVCLLALALSIWAIPRDVAGEKKERFDLPGALVFLAGLVALLVGLNRGHEWGWTSPAILLLLGTAMLLLGLFVAIERKARDPMLDLSLFRNRTFSASVASAVINYICVYSIMFLMPFYLIQGRGLGPARAGLLLTAEPIVMAVIAPISGTLSDRIGARLPGTIGMGVLAGGLFLLSRLGPASGPVIRPRRLCRHRDFISPNTRVPGCGTFHRCGIAPAF